MRHVRLYCGLLVAIDLLLATGYVVHSNLVTPNGYGIFSDFTVFWAAAHMAITGHAADAYSAGPLQHLVLELVPGLKGAANPDFGWFYPPSFYVLLLPMGYLAYTPFAYGAFILPALGAYTLVVQRICSDGRVLWVLAASSAVWVNLYRGQNGFLTAALAGASLLALDNKRPLLSGVFLGVLSIKPHLFFLFPVTLLATGHRKAVGMAVLTAGGLMVAGLAALGPETLSAWMNSARLARRLAENPPNTDQYWPAMPTLFSQCRLLGASTEMAYLVHLTVAIMAAISVVFIWRRNPDPGLRNSALVAGSLLISPYLMPYDLTWLALPIAWMFGVGRTSGWRTGEKTLLFLMWAIPLPGPAIARIIPLQVVPFLLLTLLGMILQRTLTPPNPALSPRIPQ